MKGIIFAELVRYLEETQSLAFADAVITRAKLESDGAYTSVGNYPTSEALAIVASASALSNMDPHILCRAFGSYLFGRFLVLFPNITSAYPTAEALLTHVGSHIHTEVYTLYPDARPPVITAEQRGNATVISYQSHRPMAEIAHGLIIGCMAHYGDARVLSFVPAHNGQAATFILTGHHDA